MRIQTHRVFYRQPPAPRRGRPPTKGPRFQPKAPATHGSPTATWTGADACERVVTVRAWAGLAYADAMQHPVTLLECARHHGKDRKHDPRIIRLLWDSRTEAAPLPEIPKLYPRRFGIEHGIRFDKQAVLWAEPRLRTGAFQLWTDLVMARHNTLCLARPLCDGLRLPWEARSPLTLQHVRRALTEIIPRIGSPAPPPQPREKSPGRAREQRPKPATRFSVVWKGRPAMAHAPPILT